MKDLQSPLEELCLFESWIITSHLSTMHHNLASIKKYKKIIKNDSLEAIKINTLSYYQQITKSEPSRESREKFDDFLHNSQKHSNFAQSLKDIKIYPNNEFPLWNEHIEIYNELEKNNFCESHAQNMHNFLFNNFLTPEYKFIEMDPLKQRDYNIFLILFHLDALISTSNFPQVSLYKYLIVGKVRGKKKSPIHLFWNLVKIISCIESNKKLGTSFDTTQKIPKDEDCFSLVNEQQAERIKYALRKIKENKSLFFYLSHFYQLLGAKKLFEDTQCFNNFSITGLWLMYVYTQILFKPNSILLSLSSSNLDAIYLMFKTKYKSESTHQWPSDLSI